MLQKRCAFLTAALLLSGCASAPPPKLLAWDGLGQAPNEPAQHKPRRPTSVRPPPATAVGKEAVLAGLRPYSADWWRVHDEIEDALDEQLRARLVICRLCVPMSFARTPREAAAP